MFPGSLFVIGAGLTLEWEPDAAKIADPALSAVAAIVLVIFNYPFCMSILLTILTKVMPSLFHKNPAQTHM